VKIVNTYHQLVAAGGGCAIITAHSPGRGSNPCGWAIYRIDRGREVATDPKAPWFHRGRKWFSWFNSDRMTALDEAKAFVRELTGYDGEWKRNKFHDYVPAHIHKQFPIGSETSTEPSITRP
jgi:hypothetical protein